MAIPQGISYIHNTMWVYLCEFVSINTPDTKYKLSALNQNSVGVCVCVYV